MKDVTKKQVMKLESNPVLWPYSRVLKELRQCNNCPLGARKQQVKIGKDIVERMIPASCKFYKENNKDCPIGYEDYLKRLKAYTYYKDMTDVDMMKVVIDNAMQDLDVARGSEVVQKGNAGFWTLKFTEVLGNLLKERHKMQYGEKFQGVVGIVGQDTASRIIDAMANDGIESDQDEVLEVKAEVQKELNEKG